MEDGEGERLSMALGCCLENGSTRGGLLLKDRLFEVQRGSAKAAKPFVQKEEG